MSVLDDLAGRMAVLWGWRRMIVAVLAGAVSALAMPPISLPFVLFLTLPVLVWLLDGALTARPDGRVAWFWPAARIGWAFGFGYFLAGLHWVGAAFLVDANAHGALMPLAVLALPAGLGLFWALATVLARALWSEGPGRIFALAFGFGVAEWLRGHVLSGFPWNTLGYALTTDLWIMQSASLFGIYGLTVLVIAIFAAPVALGHRRGRVVLGLAVALYGGLYGFGIWRVAEAGNTLPPEDAEQLDLRIVQANIAQDQKWRPENRWSIFERYLDLSTRDTGSGAIEPASRAPRPGRKVIIWPESAPPFFLAREAGALTAIGDALPFGSSLITGANRIDTAPGAERAVSNSVLVIVDAGTVLGTYDKTRRVPFGERMPFERVLAAIGIDKLVAVPASFTAGDRAHVLEPAGLPPFRPLICYEVIFSGQIGGANGPRPHWLLNVTNDAWFGDTLGPRQHFHFARVRAVEEGLPLVRAANTGISGVISPIGLIVAETQLGREHVLHHTLTLTARDTLAQAYSLPVSAVFLIIRIILARIFRRSRQ